MVIWGMVYSCFNHITPDSFRHVWGTPHAIFNHPTSEVNEIMGSADTQMGDEVSSSGGESIGNIQKCQLHHGKSQRFLVIPLALAIIFW